MNRFVLLGSQFDDAGQEWAFVFDSESGRTFKSPVSTVGITERVVERPVRRIDDFDAPMFTAPRAVNRGPTPTAPAARHDPTGEIETPEQRKARLGTRKVPPAFLGNTDRMMIDPSVHPDAKVDVTPFH